MCVCVCGVSELINTHFPRYDSFKYGPVSCLSFSPSSPSSTTSIARYPKQCTLDADVFVTPDVVITTSTGSVVHVTANGTVLDVSV